MFSHTDKSLPLIVRNVLARDHYEAKGGMSSYGVENAKNKLLLEVQIAAEFERLCPFWGHAVPYDGRLVGIVSQVAPRTHLYKVGYNLELAEDMRAMYDDDKAMKDELIKSMVMEFSSEIEQIIDGRDLLFYPCIVARPISVIDPATFNPAYKFDAVYYLAKPLHFSLENSPQVRPHEPTTKFINNYEAYV